MKYNDPSGHFWAWALAAFTIGVTTDDPTIKTLSSLYVSVTLGIDYKTAGIGEVLANGAQIGFANGLIQTGDIGQSVKSSFNGALTAVLTKGVADKLGHRQTTSAYLGQMGLHGVLSELRGGSFKHGAAGAFGGKFGTKVSQSLGLGNIGDATGKEARAAVSVMVGGLTSQASGGEFNQGAMTALMVHLFNELAVDTTSAALKHYIIGNGEAVTLGPNTQKSIKNNEDQKYRSDRIRTGKTNSLNGDYGVNIESNVYHVGDTTISYATKCNSVNCTTTYTSTGDGFWDPIYDSDGRGSNGEFGTPFKYESFNWSEIYPNPYNDRP